MSGRKENPGGIQLDFFTASEVDEELILLARQAGYGDNVDLYLANDGMPIKKKSSQKQLLRGLTTKASKQFGDKNRIDPTFLLYNKMKDEAEQK